MAVPPRATENNRFKGSGAEQLAGLIEPTVTSHGLYLEELTLTGKGERTLLQVVIDYAEGTKQVGLDTLAGLSEALSVVLDKAEAAASPLIALPAYELEVSTPGATRPLTEPRHFRRNIGRLLEIDLRADAPAQGAKGKGALTARLKEVDAGGVVVEEIKPAPKKGMKPKAGPQKHIGFESIARARVQVEFSHTD
ncbi:ribosome maturation factor RimP [Nesterenkonia ebinurensis]|uniref:ribosome maturation factor RimP n=1 Tax=Nesterenkonia ebinurensis TaxID=2608252 RepID=UPI00168B0E16|nr:ribosome maturation factor RimP [Nesterenkonia ebinurensis]